MSVSTEHTHTAAFYWGRSGYFGGKVIGAEVGAYPSLKRTTGLFWGGRADTYAAHQRGRSEEFKAHVWNAVRSAVRSPPLTASAACFKMAARLLFIFCWSPPNFHCLFASRPVDFQPSLQVGPVRYRLELTGADGGVWASLFRVSLRCRSSGGCAAITDVEPCVSAHHFFLQNTFPARLRTQMKPREHPAPHDEPSGNVSSRSVTRLDSPCAVWINVNWEISGEPGWVGWDVNGSKCFKRSRWTRTSTQRLHFIELGRLECYEAGPAAVFCIYD